MVFLAGPLVVPFVVLALMAKATKKKTKKKKGGAAAAAAAATGELPYTKFDPDGDDAKHILRGYLAGNLDCMTWKRFLETHSDWILSKNNPTGRYKKDNMCRNFAKVLKRYNDHVGGDVDAKYPKGFLKDVGAKGLPKRNPGNLDFAAGSAGSSSSDSSCSDSSDDDDDDDSSSDNSNNSLPSQIHHIPDVINIDNQGIGHTSVAKSKSNEKIIDIIEDLISDTSNLNMDGQVLNTKTFYNGGCKLRGGFKTEVNHVQGLIVFVPATANINTLKIDLGKDNQSYKVSCSSTGEAVDASNYYPTKGVARHNPNLRTTLESSIQLMLNGMDKDDEGNLLWKGSGKLPKKATDEGQLPLSRLYLDREDSARMWMFHKAPFSDTRRVVPCIVAIAFFAVDLGKLKTQLKLQPVEYEIPDEESKASNPSPPAGAGRPKRRRGEGGDTPMSDVSGAAAFMDASEPDPVASGGVINSLRNAMNGRRG